MISARPPNAAAGSPPPITLPKVMRSPATPSRPYQPDLVTRNPVSTSSMISSAPYSPHSADSSSLKPADGGTTPMLAGQASVMTHAMSLPFAANACRTASASLYGSTSVSAADGTSHAGRVRQAERGNAGASGRQQCVNVSVIAAGELHHQPSPGVSPGQPQALTSWPRFPS